MRMAASDRQSLDLLINDGEGIFEPRESQAQFQGNINDLAVGDLDDDGHLDVVAALYHDGNVSVALGDGAGDFAAEPVPVTVAGSASSVSLGDIDAMETWTCAWASNIRISRCLRGGRGVAVFLGQGDGGLGPRLFVADGEAVAVSPESGRCRRRRTDPGRDSASRKCTYCAVSRPSCCPRSLGSDRMGSSSGAHYAEGDWDDNGVADSLVKTITGLELRLNPGTECGADGSRASECGLDQAFLRDVTGDGRTDILTSGPSGVYVLPQDEHGQPGELVFTPPDATTLISDGIVDLNRDGAADLLLLQGTDLYAWLGQGDGSFQPLGDAAVARGRAFQVADWNTDGHADLMVLWANRLSVLHGSADGSFHETFHTAISAGTVLERVADLDGDGDLDVVLAGGNPVVVSFRGCDLRPGIGPRDDECRQRFAGGDGPDFRLLVRGECPDEKLLIGWSDLRAMVDRLASHQRRDDSCPRSSKRHPPKVVTIRKLWPISIRMAISTSPCTARDGVHVIVGSARRDLH